jgi:hypothetical protein
VAGGPINRICKEGRPRSELSLVARAKATLRTPVAAFCSGVSQQFGGRAAPLTKRGVVLYFELVLNAAADYLCLSSCAKRIAPCREREVYRVVLSRADAMSPTL